MADFNHSKIPEDVSGQVGALALVGSTGTNMNAKRLLGDEGAAAPGYGGWYRSNGLWKTFYLYCTDRKTAVSATVDVRIEACMELASDPDDPDVDTKAVELVNLAASALHFSTENPWRWIRARVVAHAGAPIQVGLFEQGQG